MADQYPPGFVPDDQPPKQAAGGVATASAAPAYPPGFTPDSPNANNGAAGSPPAATQDHPSSFWNEAVVNPAKQLMSGYQESVASGAHALGNAATGIGKLTGTKPGGFFQDTEQYATQRAKELADGRQDLASKIYRGIGATPGTIAKYMLGSEVAGPIAGMGAVDALTAADQGPVEAAKAGVKGALTGGALRAMAPASTTARTLGGAVAMGGQTALAGGDTSDVVSSALTGGAMGAGAGSASERALYQKSQQTGKVAKPSVVDPKTNPTGALIQGLRPRSTQVDFDQSLNRALPELRAAQAKTGPIEDVDSLLDAAHVAQRDVWDRYEQQGGQNIKADMSPVAQAIRASLPKKAAYENPGMVDSVNALADRYDGKVFPLQQVEDFLQETNAELATYEAKYPGVKTQLLKSNPETAGLVAQGDALRQVLYGAIDTGGGSGAEAADLKRTYGALSDVKQTAMRRKVIAERQAPLNLTQQIARIDAMKGMGRGALTAAGGIATAHPGMVLRGVGDMAVAGLEPAAAAWVKEQNSTNGLIRNAFKNYTPGPRPAVANWREGVTNPGVFTGPSTVPASGTPADAARAISENQPYSAAESANVFENNIPATEVQPFNPAAESAQVLQYAPEPEPPPNTFLPADPTGKSAAESAQTLMQAPQSKQAIESAQLLQHLPPSGQRALPGGLPPTSIQTWNPPPSAPDVGGSRRGDIVRPPRSIAHLLGRSIIEQQPPEQPPPAAAPMPPPAAPPVAPVASPAQGSIIKPDEAPVQAVTAPTAEPAQGAGRQPAVLGPRQASNPTWHGSETTIRIPGDPASYQARYALRELADVQPSHNSANLQPNPAYQLTNDRNYADPRNAERILKQVAEFDPAYLTSESPTAENGAPIIDQNGNVLGGNSRTMTLGRVYQSRPDAAQAYRDALAQKAQQYGLDPEHIASMKQPVLVRELNGYLDPTETQRAVTDMNKVGTAALTPAEQAIADSRRMSGPAMDFIGSKIEQQGPDGTLAQALEGNNGREVVQKLIDEGLINTAEKNKYLNERGLVTDEGKSRISKLLVGRLFRDPSQLDRTAPELRNKLEKVTPAVARVTGSDWDITPHLQEAIELLDEARQRGMKNLDDLRAQTGMFGDTTGYSPEAFALAKALQESPTKATKAFRQYANDANYAEGGTLLGNAPTKAEAFADAFGSGAPTMRVPNGFMAPPQ